MKAVAERAAFLQALLEDDALDLDAALEKFAGEVRGQAATEVLRRSALTRWFDAALYDAVLTRNIGPGKAPSFAEFTKFGEVEPIPASPDRYWVGDSTRARLLGEWRESPKELVELNAALAAYLEKHHPDDTAARLHHLVASDPQQAVDLFTTEFDKADAKFDLARCFSLLNVLNVQQTSIGRELHAVLDECGRRYRARALFADAYYRTGTFYYRAAPHDAFKEVLGASRSWILHLFATGGIGKTMFLRWLVSRDLVPHGVPCARMDFDDVAMDAIRSWPWLVLVPVMEQLGEQLHLAEALGLLQPFAHLLRPLAMGTVSESEAADADGRLPTAADIDQIVNRIGHALRESARGPIVIILDTLEVVTVFPETFERIFGYFAGLHRRVPEIRLVLAGRYHIATKVKALAATLENEARTFELTRFDAPEAREYLVSRNLTDPDLVGAVIEKVSEPPAKGIRAGCNPFKLSLLADLALAKKDVTPEYVRALPSADYQYLLERVIKRITEQPLRWIVRYGVIPRRLTLDYMEKVLLEPLRRALRGDAFGEDTPCDPTTLPPELQSIAEQDLWVPDPAGVPPAEQLWADLLRYESGRGWMTRVAGSGAYRGAVQFHGDVVGPMRDLLAYQRIFPVLQSATVRHFENLAQNELDKQVGTAGQFSRRWADWMCEAIFHRFQLASVGAESYWLEKVYSPVALPFSEVQLKLASEILKSEYAEDERVPRTRYGVALVSEPALAVAHLITGQCLEVLLRLPHPPSEASWSELRRHVDCAKALQASWPRPSAFAPQLALIEGAVLVHEGQPAEALSRLQAIEKAPLEASPWLGELRSADAFRGAGMTDLHRLDADALAKQQFALTYQLAEARAALRHPEAVSLYEATVELASANPALASAADLLRKLGRIHLLGGRPAEAKAVLIRAVEATAATGDAADRRATLIELADLELSLGEYSAAILLLREASNLESVRSEDDRPRDVRIAVLQGQAWAAVGCAPSGENERWRGLLRSAKAVVDRAQVRDAFAALQASELNFTAAFNLWGEAVRLLERQGAAEQLATVTLHQMQAKNRMGAHRDTLVHGAGSHESVLDDGLYAALELERTYALVRRNAREEARRVVEMLVWGHEASPPLREHSPRWRAQALALGVALGVIPPEPAHLELLLRLLETCFRMQRFEVLAPLKYGLAPVSVPRTWFRSLVSLLGGHEGMEAHALVERLRGEKIAAGPDCGAFVRTLTLIEVHRIFGETDGAEKLLESLDVEPPKWEGSVFPPATAARWLLVEEARGRLRRYGSLQRLPSFVKRLIKPPGQPSPANRAAQTLAGAALLLQRAKGLLAVDPADRRITSLLNSAQIGLDVEKLPTRWHAMQVELRGVLALHRNTRGARNQDLATAAEMYGEMGDAIAAAGALERQPTEDATEVRSPGVGTAVAQRNDVRVLVPVGPGGRAGNPDQEQFLKSLTPNPGSPISETMVEALGGDWQSLRQRLGDLLFTREDYDADLRADTPLCLQLKIPQTFLQGLPWELVVFPGEEAGQPGQSPLVRGWSRVSDADPRRDANTVRFVQAALVGLQNLPLAVDGILGPQTSNAIEVFQQQANLPVTGQIHAHLISALTKHASRGETRILLIQPGVQSEVEQTSYAGRSGVALDDYYGYGSLGKVTKLIDPGADEVVKALADTRPGLVHLVGAVRETGGMAFLDFTSRRGSSKGGQLTTTTLDEHVKRRYRDRPGPFLILDIARPSSTFEAAWALGLRNVFASQLLHFGSFSGVLATGLEPPSMLGSLAEEVVEAVSQGFTMGELARGVRARFATWQTQPNAPELDAVLAYLGTALFAQNPDLPCLAL